MSKTPYTNEDDVADAVRANYAAQLQALLAGDADALGELLTDDFSQTHLTGQRQPRGDWLTAVRSGEMSYRAVDVVEESVDLSSGMPVLSARTRTDATIWGARGTWPLSVRMLFAFDGTTWLASSALASVWR